MWLLLLLLLTAGIRSCLFHLNVAVQLLESDLVCLAVDDQHALLLSVVALVALENRAGNSGSICGKQGRQTYGTPQFLELTQVGECHSDRVVGSSL